jgi:hypothetical protein
MEQIASHGSRESEYQEDIVLENPKEENSKKTRGPATFPPGNE